MSKNTIFISFDGLSDPLGQSQILPYLRGIAQAGYKVQVLSCEKLARVKADKDKITADLRLYGIAWDYLIYDENGSWWTRWQYTRQLKRLAKKTVLQKQIGLVHCRSYLAALVGLSIKRKFKIPFVFDMRGFWADERLDGGIWNKSRILHRILYYYFKRQEKILLSAASAVVSLTQAGLNELCRIYPNLHLQEKTQIIPCCTNTQLFDPEKVIAKQIEHLPAQAHLLVYTGSIGTWYMTKELLECLSIWRKQIPNLCLLFVTRDQHALQALLKNCEPSLKEIIYTAEANHSEIPAYLKLAKAAIFFIKPAYSKKASSPTKMAECWAMGLPVITNAGVGDNDLYFKQFNAGVLVSALDETAYKRACEEYLNKQFSSTEIRHIALNYFDHRTAIEKYLVIYSNVFTNASV